MDEEDKVEVHIEPKIENVQGVFSTLAHLMLVERKKHDTFREYVFSLIQKFMPIIEQMDKSVRYLVIQDALLAWMSHAGSTRLTFSDIEAQPTICKLLGMPTKRDFIRMLTEMPRFRAARYHDRHKGVMRDHVAVYEVIPEEEE